MTKGIKRVVSMLMCLIMLLSITPISAMGLDTYDVSELGEPILAEESADVAENPPTESTAEDAPSQHWLQEYQEWALSQSRMRGFALMSEASASPSYTFITWESGSAYFLRFANGAYIGSPMPKIYLNGEIAFCGQWNGETPSGSYEQDGTGGDRVIKQILANYDNSGKSNADYAAAQAAIWARVMGTSVSSWGGCPGSSSANAIMNGSNDYSNLKYNYIEWSGGTQDLITYNTEEPGEPEDPEDPDDPDEPELPEYPEDEYRVEVETDTQTETEVRHRTSYEYSDAIGQLTIRKHDQDGKSLDGALFNIDVKFSDGSHTTVENWEVDNGARLFTWTHPQDNHEPATVTVTEVEPPRYYIGDPTPQTAVVTPTYTRVTHVETWTATITTETTTSTVIEITSGEVVAETSSSSSSESNTDPQVEEYSDFVEGDRETTVTFVNSRITGSIEVLKKDANTGTPLAGATIHLWGDDLGEAGLIDKTQVTGPDGIARFTGLPIGTYVIQETQAPFGYNLDDEKQTAALQSGETIRKEVHNYRKDGLIIKKVDSNGEPLSGAVFELRRGSGEVLLSDTTDANGIIFRDHLTDGLYVIEEKQAPDGYMIGENPIKEIYIHAADDNKSYTVAFVNDTKPKLLIEKVDAATGEKLPGAVFRVAERGGNEYIDVTTDAEGTVLLEDLNEDWYTVHELRAPVGYVTDDTHYDVELVRNQTATLTVRNHGKPTLTVSKIDSVTKEPMQGVVFEIAIKNGKSLGEFTTNEQGLITLKKVEPGEIYVISELQTLDGYLIDKAVKEIKLDANQNVIVPFENTPKNPILIKKLDDITGDPIEDTTFLVTKVNGEYVGEYTTGKQGYATVAGVDPGWYIVKEIRANSGYMLSSEAKNVQLIVGEPAIVEFYNRPKTGLQIVKTDAVTGKPLEGVKFTVTELSGAVIGEYETDKDGLIHLDGQEEKWVRVTETETLPGYKPDREPRLIELKSDTLNILEYENRPYPVLKISKVDADSGEPLEGVSIRLCNAQKRELGTYVTNSRGLIMLTGMDAGTYYVQETAAAAGYKLNDAFHQVVLTWGKTSEVKIENRLKPFEVSVTKTGSQEVTAGDVMRYDFSDIANLAEIELFDFYWHEALPADAVRICKIVTGTWSDRLPYSITYCTNKDEEYAVAEDRLCTNVSYDIDLSAEALGLEKDEYVTDVRFEFGTVPAGFHEVNAPEFYVTTLASLPDGYRIVNRTDVGGQRSGKWAVDKDSWVTVVWNVTETALPKTGF